MANGANELLDEVAKAKVTGAEEAFSHTDLVDMQANVEGARKVVELLGPVLKEKDSTLTTSLDQRFTQLQALLDTASQQGHLRLLRHRSAGAAAIALGGRRRPVRAAEPGGGRRRGRMTRTVSRRGLLGAVGGAALAAGAGAGAGWAALRSGDAEAAVAAGTPVPFHGAHQAGIATAVQDRLHMAAFDLTSDSKADLVDLLRRWTAAAERMTRGLEVVEGGAAPAVADAPPDDSGEALGLPASRLTLTLGLGAGVFEAGGKDRFGLRRRRPSAFVDLPRFARDDLDADRSGGDLVVQACADDPQVAVHAVRNLARLAMGTAAVRWSQLGFGRTSSTTPAEQTPRNLFGFKDGTNNIAGDDADSLRRARLGRCCRGPGAGVDRRRQLPGDAAHRDADRVLGPDVARRAGGRHRAAQAVRRASRRGRRARRRSTSRSCPPGRTSRSRTRDANGGHRILRRGYSYVDGSDGLGRLDAGLFFLAYCRDPRTQYVPMQTRMARSDRMAEYFTHVASGLYAVPPGTQPGEYWAQRLLEA